jgi:hypothetical protein
MRISYKKIMITSWIPVALVDQMIRNTSGVENRSLLPIVHEGETIGYACSTNNVNEEPFKIHHVDKKHLSKILAYFQHLLI